MSLRKGPFIVESNAHVNALWPLVAQLGLAATHETDQVGALRTLLSQLAILCGATVDLWRVNTNIEQVPVSWRLLITEDAHPQGNQPATATRQPDEAGCQAAVERHTVVVKNPTAKLAFPLIAWQQLQGVLVLQAPTADSKLLAWKAPLQEFVPLIATFLTMLDQPLLSLAPGEQRYLGDAVEQEVLQRQVEREISRARRNRQACAVLLLRPDQFDTLGTEIGDQMREAVMEQIGTAMQTTCRGSDLVGRYGPELFLLLLPDSDTQGASFVAQRFLEQFYVRPIVLPDHEPLYLDLSIGIALFPVDGLTTHELLQRATDALAEARRLGGRRAVAA